MFASKDSLLTRPSGYTIARSVRLRSSASAYFNRTPSTTGSTQKLTYSAWVKRGTLGSYQHFGLSAAISSLLRDAIRFNSGDVLEIFLNEASSAYLVTTQLFRDPSAWYHIVVAIDTTQATSSDRIKVYVNGVQVTAFSTSTYPSQNYNFTGWNVSGKEQNIGRSPQPLYYFDGYLTEINFVDGQQLTPSSFGTTNATIGVWQPAKYTGTYGTNGFYLNFSDNSASTAATIGKDYSGNGNNWTPNNISVTAGSTYDSMTDVPTLTSATAANYAVLNPLATNTVGVATLTNGNLTFSVPNTFTAIGSMSATSGKYYWEAIATSNPVGVGLKQVNVLDRYSNTIYYMGSSLSPSGEKYVNGTGSAYGASWTTGDVIGVAVDMDGGTVTFYKNNASQGSIALSTASITAFVPSFVAGAGVTFAGSVNFGQQPFTYTPPTGYVALNTYNLPASTIKNGAAYMAATVYTGNSPSSQSISNAVNGVSFQPDWVWQKSRSQTYNHTLYDSVRGTTKELYSNTTGAEVTDTNGLTAFTSSGFTVGSDGELNDPTGTHVAWQWKAGGTSSSNTNGSITSTVSAGATQGFSVVTYTGTGANATVGHGLGVAPSMVIVKSRSVAARGWIVWHSAFTATEAIEFDTGAKITSTTSWNSTLPTSTVISLGTRLGTNESTTTFVAYCFAAVAGYSAFGSYTGNGSTDGPFIYTGFRPRWLMTKRTDSSVSGDWNLVDTSRGTYNAVGPYLYANQSAAEGNAAIYDILSNGFKIRETGSGTNANGGTYIYACFAENPFKNALAR